MPSADFCAAMGLPRGFLSPSPAWAGSTRRRPPEVSSTAFPAHLPDLHPRPLMDEDFAVSCPLVRPGLPHIRFLFVRSRFCSTLLSDPASRRRPCASLALHLHQVVQGTCTPKLSNMLGTQLNRFAADEDPCRLPGAFPPAAIDLLAQLFPAKILRTDVRPIPSRRAISD